MRPDDGRLESREFEANAPEVAEVNRTKVSEGKWRAKLIFATAFDVAANGEGPVFGEGSPLRSERGGCEYDLKRGPRVRRLSQCESTFKRA